MAKADKGRPPDFRLRAFNKQTEKGHNVGAGWMSEDGTVTIVLDPFVVLRTKKDYSFHLFPADDSNWSKMKQIAKKEATGG
jgi:hypothetical protein